VIDRIAPQTTPARRAFAWAALTLSLFMLAPATVVNAQGPSVDQLLERIFGSDSTDPYYETADFDARLLLNVRGLRLTAVAAGNFAEFREQKGGPVKRKINIERLDLPVLLRPFAATIRRVIQERGEQQSENPEDWTDHDFFILEQRADKKYVVVGVRRDRVNQAIKEFGRGKFNKDDTNDRRAVARWLYTSPTMKEFLTSRAGGAYAAVFVTDELGRVYEQSLLYDWGKIGTKITWGQVTGIWVWKQLDSDVVSDVAGFGRVTGDATLTFSNHCWTCKK
jgi:hypothetical protein